MPAHGSFAKLPDVEGASHCEWPQSGCDGEPVVLRYNENVGQAGGYVLCCGTCAITRLDTDTCGSCSMGVLVATGGDDLGVQICDECAQPVLKLGPVVGDHDAMVVAQRALRAIETIREILWPAGDMENPWGAGTCDEIARQLHPFIARQS
jgi:hypothetical protein